MSKKTITAKAAEQIFVEEMVALGLRSTSIRTGSAQSQVIIGCAEICLVIIPAFKRRPAWRAITGWTYLAFVDKKYMEVARAGDLELAVQDMCIFSANSRALNCIHHIGEEAVRDDIKRLVEGYRGVLQHYPKTRAELLQSIFDRRLLDFVIHDVQLNARSWKEYIDWASAQLTAAG